MGIGCLDSNHPREELRAPRHSRLQQPGTPAEQNWRPMTVEFDATPQDPTAIASQAKTYLIDSSGGREDCAGRGDTRKNRHRNRRSIAQRHT